MQRCWIAGLLLLAACAQRTPVPVFPPAVAGGWQLKASQHFGPNTAPELVRKIGTRGWWSATYEGPGTATVAVYELTSAPGGLQMVQEWRPAADTAVWYTPRYFVVVKWQSADRAAVSAFIRALEKQLGEEK